MPEPSLYIYIIFLVLFYKLIKKSYWQNVLKDIKKGLKNNIFNLMLVILFNLIIISFVDLPVSRYFSGFENHFLDKVFEMGNHLGNGETLFSFLLIAIIISLLLNFNKLKIIFSISIMSSIFSGLAVNLLKIIFVRERPVINLNPHSFFAFIKAYNTGELFQYPYLSMPSGHTITIIAAVVPLYLYFNNKIIRTGLIILAAYISFSRIFTLAHWTSDVFTSVILGIFLAKIIYKNNKSKLKT